MIHGRLRLFGELRLTPGPDPHAPPVELGTDPLWLLLAYLVLHASQPVNRQKVAFLLWPDASETAALRYLRQHLHRLRQILAQLKLPDTILESNAGHLHFDPAAELWVDVIQFQQQIANRQRQIEAIELYEGELLAGYEAGWLQPHRSHFQERYLQALRTQINGANMQRNYGRALYYARRLLQANPLRESSHRIYMEALYFNGQRVEALHHFADLQALLQQELNVAPMAETAELYQQIKQGTLPRDIPLLVSSSRRPPQALKAITQISTSFIGRRQELAHLDDILARTLGGDGRFVLITGEDGIGKSALLNAWLQARAGQLATFQATCREEAPCLPAGAIVEALRHGHHQIEWEWFPPQFPHLKELQQLLSSQAPPAGSPFSVEKMGQWLLTLAQRKALGLFLDDLHQADQTTWEILSFLARRCGRFPLLLVGTCRLTRLSPLARRLLHNLQRHRQVTTMPLLPFSREETAGLAAHVLGQRPGIVFLNHLHRATEGNPFFIMAFLQAAQESEAPLKVLQRVPEMVRTAIEARLVRVRPLDQQLLARVARIGRTFDFNDVAIHAPHLSEEQIVAALENAIHHGLLQEFGDGYTFTHRLIRLVAQTGLQVPPP